MHDDVSVFRDGELRNLHGSADPGEDVKSPGRVARRIKTSLDLLDKCFRAILVLALVTELAIVLTEIFSRFWFQTSLLWSDDAGRRHFHPADRHWILYFMQRVGEPA
jgi:hypothetical protein